MYIGIVKRLCFVVKYNYGPLVIPIRDTQDSGNGVLVSDTTQIQVSDSEFPKLGEGNTT